MKLLNLENRYILIYRVTILIVISIALITTIVSSIYAVVKYSGMLAKSDQQIVERNIFKEPDLKKFTNRYENKKPLNEKPKLIEKEIKPEQNDDTSNKNILFKQQAERLASLQKAFMEEQKKEFADLELKTLKSEILKLLSSQKIPAVCDKYNKEKTEKICVNNKIEKQKGNSGVILFFDTIDISTYSSEFYEKEINFFELQYSFVSEFLTNSKIIKLYSEGKIISPTTEAITEFYLQFSDNNALFWQKRAENIATDKQNKQSYEIKKLQDKAESIQILLFAAGAFGIFILIMFFVIFYRIERNLNTISELNTNMLENMKK